MSDLFAVMRNAAWSLLCFAFFSTPPLALPFPPHGDKRRCLAVRLGMHRELRSNVTRTCFFAAFICLFTISSVKSNNHHHDNVIVHGTDNRIVIALQPIVQLFNCIQRRPTRKHHETKLIRMQNFERKCFLLGRELRLHHAVAPARPLDLPQILDPPPSRRITERTPRNTFLVLVQIIAQYVLAELE